MTCPTCGGWCKAIYPDWTECEKCQRHWYWPGAVVSSDEERPDDAEPGEAITEVERGPELVR